MNNYLIWSHEHGGWWGPAERGYYKEISRAGVYSRQLAMKICQAANAYLPTGSPPNEIPVLQIDATECIK